MERHVMFTLEWVLGAPTVDGFLQIALDDGMYDPEVEHMARYISEIALFHKDFVSTRPSHIAKASLALSRVILNRVQPHSQDWASQYESPTLIALSRAIHHPSQILFQKYKSLHLSRVSMILEDFLQKHAEMMANQMAPPSPPYERAAQGDGTKMACNGPFQTPQKSQQPASMPHGCLTPPITPESECFGVFNPGIPARIFPGTPTSVGSKSQGVYGSSYYQPASIM